MEEAEALDGGYVKWSNGEAWLVQHHGSGERTMMRVTDIVSWLTKYHPELLSKHDRPTVKFKIEWPEGL